jgi:hypothetical protein
MPLRSKLLAGDPKLEAAAVSDAAHIVPGARGPHVGKLQVALIQLDGAAISQDEVYGPATAAAVLAYKRKRNIVNRSRQTQADNIVGIMTMAALDGEMRAKESIPVGPVRIRPVDPIPRGGAPTLRLGFKIDVDFPVFPNGDFLKIRLVSRTTGKLEIVNGANGRVRCTNIGKSQGKISFAFDPDDLDFLPGTTRLIPGPRGQFSGDPLANGGTVRVTRDPFTIHVDAFHPGNAFIDAATSTSANTLALEVRASKIANVPGFAPPTKTRPNSRFISADDSEPSPPGVRKDNGGRPVNPKGTGRKINIFGSQETPGFEDYTTDLLFSGFAPGKFQLVSDASTIFRPWTEDLDRAAAIGAGTASDICIRDSPVFPVTAAAIRRIASPGCRLTFASTVQGVTQFVPVLESIGFKTLEGEKFPDAVVMELT